MYKKTDNSQDDDDMESVTTFSDDSEDDLDNSTTISTDPGSPLTEEDKSMLSGNWTESPKTPLPPKPVVKKGCPKPDFLYVCFFTLNFFFLLLGTLMFVFGVLVVTNAEIINNISKNIVTGRLTNVDIAGVFRGGSTGLIITGVITFIIGCLGIIGIGMGSIYILYLYGGLISATIASQVLGFLMAFIFRNNILENAKTSLLKSLAKNYDGLKNSTSLFSQSLDTAQVFLGCCGIDSWIDFQNTPWYRRINNLPEPTTTTLPPCTYINVTRNTTDLSGNNGTSPDPGIILTTCIYVYNTTTPTTILPNATTPRSALLMFPDSCCQATAASVFSLASEGTLQLLDPDCPLKNASVGNPNSAVGCFDAMKSWLFNQTILILSLAFTIIGVEVSAVSNTYSVVKDLKKKAEKAKLLTNVSALTGGTQGSSPFLPGSSASNLSAASSLPHHPRRRRKKPSNESVEEQLPDFRSSLIAFVGGDVHPSPKEKPPPPLQPQMAPMSSAVLVMGPTGPQLTFVAMPTAPPPSHT
ncbi:hypothetical protein ACOMHN_051502 [Nucella lapillus]